MPKQQVIGNGGPFDVVVGWGPEAVQIGVEAADGRSVLTELYGGAPSLLKIAEQACELLGVAPPGGQTSDEQAELRTSLGRRLLDIVEANPNDVAAPYTGLFAGFGRSSVNDLIRVVRRARDVAFGKDQ